MEIRRPTKQAWVMSVWVTLNSEETWTAEDIQSYVKELLEDNDSAFFHPTGVMVSTPKKQSTVKTQEARSE